MKKIFRFVFFGLLIGLLTACNVPATASAPATETPIPPAATVPSLPPTETAVPGPAVRISKIDMLDAAQGWGWEAVAENTYRLLRTADGGQTWRDVSPQGQAPSPYSGYFLDSQNAWLSVVDPATNAGSLLHTKDGGQSWDALSLPQAEAAQNAIYRFSTPLDGVATTVGVGAGNAYFNLFQTHDGGATWTPILIAAPQPEPGLPAGTVHLCNICGDGLYYDGERSVISYGDLASDPVGVVRLAVSTDLGQHWAQLELPLPDAKYADGSVAPQSPHFFGADGFLPVNIMKYGADGALAYSVLVTYFTHDGGQAWSAAPAILENTRAMVDSVQIFSMQAAIVRCGRNLCATSDGARSWNTLPESLNFDSSVGGPDYVSQFDFVNPATGWAIAGEGMAVVLWKTSDGGATWSQIAPTLAP